jgi:hypothetical protein
MAKDFKNIKKGALLSKLGKLKKPNPNDTELSLMEELLDSTDDDAPWFYNPDEFNWNSRNQLEIKTRESNVDDVIRGFKSVSPSKKGTGEKSYALYQIGTKKVKIEATKKGLSDLSAATITKMQERGAAVVFERAIKDNVKFKDAQAIVKDKGTYDRLLEIWQKEGEDIVDMEWIKSFYKMTCTLMAKVSPRNIEEFDRDEPGGFMEYITKVIGSDPFNISKKDNWDPADVWLIRDRSAAEKAINEVVERNGSLKQLNAVMQSLFSTVKDPSGPTVFGISLKKVSKGDCATLEYANHNPKFFKDLKSIEIKFQSATCDMSTKESKGEKVLGTQDTRFIVKSNGGTEYNFQIKANDSAKFSGLKYEPTAKGAGAARIGKATVELVIRKMEHFNKSFDPSKDSYPVSLDDLIDKNGEDTQAGKNIKEMLSFIKAKGVNLVVNKVDEAYENLLMSMGSKPYVANSKIQQITWLNEIMSLSKEDLDDFSTDFVFMAKKEGEKYGPFAKLF